jgi:hypothetical protein
MEALTATKAAFVDPATLGDEATVTTAIPRTQVEDALKQGSGELWLDLERSRDGKDQASRRVTLSWEAADLERLLSSTSADPVPLAFRPEELNRMFEEPDVEAQGLRETAAILTVALATAAGTTAGAAQAMVATDGGGSGSAPAAQVVTDTTSSGPGAVGATPAEAASQFVTDTTSSGPAQETPAAEAQFVTDTTSSGPAQETPAAEAQFVTDTTSSGPAQTAAESSSGGGGGGSSWVSSAGGEAALAGGIVLLIAAAGFATTRHRTRPPKPA